MKDNNYTMTNDRNVIIAEMINLFPDQIKVHDLVSTKNNEKRDSTSLLHKHFREPLSIETEEKLIWEIAEYLKDKEQPAVYSFFYRYVDTNSSDFNWNLSSARLHMSDEGLPREVVIFSYNLQLFGNIKRKLYPVLENDEFFKEHFIKVALLTKREKEIIKLVATGMSNPEIADAMFISTHTVTTHRKNINNKLSIKNIAGLLKFANVFELTTLNHRV